MRIYKTGIIPSKKESTLRRYFRETEEYLGGVTIARQAINRKIAEFYNDARGNIVDIGRSLGSKSLNNQSKIILIDIIDASENDITANAEELPFATNSVDNFLCLSVLEHTTHPRAVIEEILRTLKPGGRVLFSVPWIFEAHMQPNDYHRFSIDLLKTWFKEYKVISLEAVNNLSGLISHFLQASKLLKLFLGLPFLFIDKLGKPNFTYSTQINAILEKQKTNDLYNNKISEKWTDNLRCPKCAKQELGILIWKNDYLVCVDCNIRYNLKNGRRPIFV